MWKNLQAFLEADATLEIDTAGNAASDHLIVGVLAILLEAAYADGGLGSFEIDRAVETLAQEFQKDEATIRAQVEVADYLSRDTTKLSKLIESIRTSFNESQKMEILKAAWKVIKADAKVDRSEAVFAAALRKSLDLTLEQAAFASKC